ncbi:MAG: hypothetical protein ABI882_02220 [Acidobacteriota bacterium]
MFGTDNQEARLSAAESGKAHYSSDVFNDAVNSSRFVKSFGIAAVVYSLLAVFALPILGVGIGVGAGLFIMRYDEGRYYRVLGLIVIIGALAGFFLPVIGSTVLSGTILGKAIQVLRVLSVEGRTDEEWPASQRRTLIGAVTSSIGLFVSVLLLILTTIGLAAMLLQKSAEQ